MRMKLGTLKKLIREAVEEAMADPTAATGKSPAMSDVYFESTSTFSRLMTKDQYVGMVADVYSSLRDDDDRAALVDERISQTTNNDMRNYLNKLNSKTSVTKRDIDDIVAAAIADKYEEITGRTLMQSQVKSVIRDIDKSRLNPESASQAWDAASARKPPAVRMAQPGDYTPMVGTSGGRTLD